MAGTPLLQFLLSPAAQTAHLAAVSWQHKGEGSAVSLLIALLGLEEAEEEIFLEEVTFASVTPAEVEITGSGSVFCLWRPAGAGGGWRGDARTCSGSEYARVTQAHVKGSIKLWMGAQTLGAWHPGFEFQHCWSASRVTLGKSLELSLPGSLSVKRA